MNASRILFFLIITFSLTWFACENEEKTSDSTTIKAEDQSQPVALHKDNDNGNLTESDSKISEILTSISADFEEQKLEYDFEKMQDASGIYHKIKDEFQKRMPTLAEGVSFQYPPVNRVRTTRQIADWYFENGNLQIVQDAMTSRNLIRPGSVMFYGRSEESFQNINIDELTDRKNNYTQNGIIQQIAVVTAVKKDEDENVVEYTIMHGRRPGKIASRSNSKEIQSTRTKGLPPFGNWKQQWVAIANTIYTPAK